MQLQDSASRLEFLRGRMSVVGGSDMGALLGVDPYRNAYDVYLEKTREPTADQANNIHMLRGIMLEDLAAQLYVEDTGRKVRRLKQRTHPDFPFFGVNVDRQILRSNGSPTGAMEIKAPATAGFQRLLDEGAQVQHTVQLMWAIFVLGYTWGEYLAINLEHNNGPVVHFPIDRNEALCENMKDAGEQFWHNHVEPRVPPTTENWPYYQAPLEVPAAAGAAHIIKTGDDLDMDLAYIAVLGGQSGVKDAEEEYAAAKARMLELAGERRIKVTGVLGSVSVFWNKGRRTFSSSRLEACGPLDPDKIQQVLDNADRLGADGGGRAIGPEEILSCTLDLTPFYNVADAFQVVRPTPKKNP